MSLVSLHSLEPLLHQFGYATVFVGLMLESIGLPLPGESLMIAAAVFAGTTHQLNVIALVGAAAAGAICGDQIGYGIGRWVGYPALKRFGTRLGLTEERFELGRFLFHKYGGRIVFLGRFVAFLRTFVSLLAGANQMPWHSFLIWNVLGGVAWTSLYGFGAYFLGHEVKRISGPFGITLAVIGGGALIAAVIFVKRNEQRLTEEAKRDMERSGKPRTAREAMKAA